jgi:hypothetical protein
MRATTTCAAMLAATALAGCLTDQPPTTPVVADAHLPPPAPDLCGPSQARAMKNFGEQTRRACCGRLRPKTPIQIHWPGTASLACACAPMAGYDVRKTNILWSEPLQTPRPRGASVR